MSQPMQVDAKIDESLYSRQLYVLGHEAMSRMSGAHVLVSGMSGTGLEIAKNIVLAGVGAVTLHDTQALSLHDLSSYFFGSEADVGRNRAELALPKIAELNAYVRVTASTAPLDSLTLDSFSVVVCVDYPLRSLVALNQHLRSHGVKMVVAESRGLCGLVFCDFTDSHIVVDKDGEEPYASIVTNIEKSTTAGAPENTYVVEVNEDNRLTVGDGDVVRFESLIGSEALNEGNYTIKVLSPYTFSIQTSAPLAPFVRGGYVHEVKQPVNVPFASLQNQIAEPECLIVDFAKMDTPAVLHTCFLALSDFIAAHHRLPKPFDAADSAAIIGMVPAEHQERAEVRMFANTCSGNLNAIAAFLGGTAAQEVLKAVSGKFSPIRQFLYFDAFELYPKTTPNPASIVNDRYVGQSCVIGPEMQKQLAGLKYLIVGAGALGCEFLKNFALSGIGLASAGGQVVVTDMDTIEVSNLSRQFLFRKSHVGQLKSVVAGHAAMEMNPAMRVVALSDKIAPETEDTFNDRFWDSLDGVTNALDNIQARLYVDQRCVYYKKSLLESGTLGTKANSQVVVPFITESYGSSRDPPEKSIPICTLKNFPYQIEHTIQWARDLFEGLFASVPRDVNAFVHDPAGYLQQQKANPATRKTTLESVLHAVRNRPRDYKDCVVWAREKFEELFANDMKQLLFNFPVDQLTSTGQPFWSGLKRPPHPLNFAFSDETIRMFVEAAALLCANVHGIAVTLNESQINDVLKHVSVTPFSPKQGVKIAASDAELQGSTAGAAAGADTEEAEIAVIERELMAIVQQGHAAGVQEVEFEKDREGNGHIEFVTAASNLRARCYQIPEADTHKTKRIAGKIIPAMVTTTALITGLVMLELFKITAGETQIDRYKNAFVNLALPFFTMSEPIAAPQTKWKDLTFSLWSVLDVPSDLSLKEFLDFMLTKYGLEVSMLASGQTILYSSFGNPQKMQERMGMSMSGLYESISKKRIGENQVFLVVEAMCEDATTHEDVEVPSIRIKIK